MSLCELPSCSQLNQQTECMTVTKLSKEAFLLTFDASKVSRRR